MLRIIGRGYLGTFIGEALGVKPEPHDTEVKKGDTVINCAGLTGRPNIDALEGKLGEAFAANVFLPIRLADKAGFLIHISSGCLYDGAAPHDDGCWREDDEPNLLCSVYAQSKRRAELALINQPDVLCLRVRMPLSPTPHPRNLITKVRSYPKVIDAQNSVTYLPDLVEVLRLILAGPKMPTGLLNVVSPDTISPFQLHPEATPVRTLYGLTKVPRSNCQLSVAKLEKVLGHRMPPLAPRLPEILESYAASV